MSTFSSKPSSKKNGMLILLIIFISLFISETAFSQKHWNRDRMHVSYDTSDKAILITFEFLETDSLNPVLKGVLDFCNFEFSTNGVYYTHLMAASADSNWTWVYMTNKLTGADLQFIGSYNPPSGTWWKDNTNVKVLVDNQPITKYRLTIKWLLGSPFQQFDKIFIRINGKWSITGIHEPDLINNEVYKVTTQFIPDLKSEIKTNLIQKYSINQTDIKPLKISSEADAIVIKGAMQGENIKVYNSSGVEMKSIVNNNDVAKIKLPVNQIYLVYIGQAKYKVAL